MSSSPRALLLLVSSDTCAYLALLVKLKCAAKYSDPFEAEAVGVVQLQTPPLCAACMDAWQLNVATERAIWRMGIAREGHFGGCGRR